MDSIDRELRSAEEIWAEVDQLLRLEFRALFLPEIELQLPQRLPSPDLNGCNWRIIGNGKTRGFETVLWRVVDQVRAKWNLK